MLLLLLACAETGQSPGGCEGYSDPAVADYCWMRQGVSAGSPQEARERCGRAGALSEECRSAWVGGHLALGESALMEVCEGAPDCAFLVLDAHPRGEVIEQLRACEERAGPYAEDCAVHALERWYRARPGAAAAARLSESALFPERVGSYLAAMVACRQVGQCGGAPEVEAACHRSLEEIAGRPAICEGLEGRR